MSVSGYFFFSAGVASLVVPSGMSAILDSAEGMVDQVSSNIFASRSYGNRMVLVFLIALMILSVLLQLGMFLAIRRENKLLGSKGARKGTE